MQVEQAVIIKDGRIYELLNKYFQLRAADQGSWCKLFNTKGYQRRDELSSKIIKHVHRMFDKQQFKDGLNWFEWNIERCGDSSLIAVQRGRNQYYKIKKVR